MCIRLSSQQGKIHATGGLRVQSGSGINVEETAADARTLKYKRTKCMFSSPIHKVLRILHDAVCKRSYELAKTTAGMTSLGLTDFNL